MRGLTITVAVLLVAAGAAVRLRQPASPVTVDQAVQSFRTASEATVPQHGTPTASIEPPAPTGPRSTVATSSAGQPHSSDPKTTTPARPRPDGTLRAPAEGVYVYDTRGGGSTDALGGARHDYPPNTPVTVRRTSCGYVIRWQPLEERWDEWEFCLAADELTLLRITTFVRFYGQSRRQDYACDRSPSQPGSAPPGSSRTYSCRSSDTTLVTTTTVVGTKVLRIGEDDVRAIHVRHETEVSGNVEGHQRADWWLHPDSTLPVRMERVANVTSGSGLSRANYKEEYSSTATSLEPNR